MGWLRNGDGSEITHPGEDAAGVVSEYVAIQLTYVPYVAKLHVAVWRKDSPRRLPAQQRG